MGISQKRPHGEVADEHERELVRRAERLGHAPAALPPDDGQQHQHDPKDAVDRQRHAGIEIEKIVAEAGGEGQKDQAAD